MQVWDFRPSTGLCISMTIRPVSYTHLMSTMLQAGLDISPIITHHFDIKDYEKGFEAMISGESGKVILDWAHVND